MQVLPGIYVSPSDGMGVLSLSSMTPVSTRPVEYPCTKVPLASKPGGLQR